MGNARKRLGDAGESAAADWYAHQGYEIVARNWRCRDGEIDLIVVRGGELVISEVKTRSSVAFGSGAEAVDWRKQQRLRRLAGRWITECCASAPRSIRVDVGAVLAPSGILTIEVIEGAF